MNSSRTHYVYEMSLKEPRSNVRTHYVQEKSLLNSQKQI